AFYPLYLGVSLLGAVPAVLAYPNARLHPDKFRLGLQGMAQHSGLDWLLTERTLEPIVRPLVDGQASTVRGLLFPLEWSTAAASSPPRPTLWRGEADTSMRAPCLLQHSSGTTGLQKAVM